MELNLGKNGAAPAADQLRDIVDKAEVLLATLGDGGDAAVSQLRQRVEATVRNAQQKLRDLESQAQNIAGRSVHNTDAYVQGHPWTAVAVAAAVGAVVGALVSRRV
jgi:ElaB/YqjD/DUF883 family membrane-anchored ribosome-binding protein